MQLITVTTARVRKTPGWRNKPDQDAIGTLNAYTIVEGLGDYVVTDEIIWQHVTAFNQPAYIATSSPNEAPILLPYDPNEDDYAKAFRFVLSHEGGLLNASDARAVGDRGGCTKYGIAQAFHPGVDVEHLTVEQAKEIYRQEYWIQSNADRLVWPMNIIHFDTAVNCGVGKARSLLTASSDSPSAYLNLRRDFYRSLNQFSTFGSGWMKRVDELQKYVGL